MGARAGIAYDSAVKADKKGNHGSPHLQVALAAVQALACDPATAADIHNKEAAERLMELIKGWSASQDGKAELAGIFRTWTSKACKPGRSTREAEGYIAQHKIIYHLDPLGGKSPELVWRMALDLTMIMTLQGGKEEHGPAPPSPLERELVRHLQTRLKD